MLAWMLSASEPRAWVSASEFRCRVQFMEPRSYNAHTLKIQMRSLTLNYRTASPKILSLTRSRIYARALQDETPKTPDHSCSGIFTVVITILLFRVGLALHTLDSCSYSSNLTTYYGVVCQLQFLFTRTQRCPAKPIL